MSVDARQMTDVSIKMFDRYLDLLGITRSTPDEDYLIRLTSAHLIRIPFENISKIYRAKFVGQRNVPPLEEFLDGIEKLNFGGTCYANNYYLHLLLLHLGFEARLCAADISVEGAPPNGHMLNTVTIDGREVIIDVGFGAPFWRPIPRDTEGDVELRLGSERYVFRQQDTEGRTRLEMYRNGTQGVGYTLKPHARRVEDFADVIARSYTDQAAFLNRLVFSRFFEDHSLDLRNRTLMKLSNAESSSRELKTPDEIAEIIVSRFGILESIVTAVLGTLQDALGFHRN